jgi:hypothetical protein
MSFEIVLIPIILISLFSFLIIYTKDLSFMDKSAIYFFSFLFTLLVIFIASIVGLLSKYIVSRIILTSLCIGILSLIMGFSNKCRHEDIKISNIEKDDFNKIDEKK